MHHDRHYRAAQNEVLQRRREIESARFAETAPIIDRRLDSDMPEDAKVRHAGEQLVTRYPEVALKIILDTLCYDRRDNLEWRLYLNNLAARVMK
jgi:hypothetical protein